MQTTVQARLAMAQERAGLYMECNSTIIFIGIIPDSPEKMSVCICINTMAKKKIFVKGMHDVATVLTT